MSLLEFYQAYYLWATTGELKTPVERIFSKHAGLCYAANYFDKKVNETCSSLKESLRKDLITFFSHNYGYPFGGWQAYSQESRSGTCHLNKVRLNFVLKRIKELEKESS